MTIKYHVFLFYSQFCYKSDNRLGICALRFKRSGKSSFARSTRANVFAAQKQCFCLERLSALFLAAISSRSADLAHKVHWTLCFKPNHALKEFETRYAISSSVKALFALRSKRKGRSSRKRINLCIGIIKSKLTNYLGVRRKNGN